MYVYIYIYIYMYIFTSFVKNNIFFGPFVNVRPFDIKTASEKCNMVAPERYSFQVRLKDSKLKETEYL